MLRSWIFGILLFILPLKSAVGTLVIIHNDKPILTRPDISVVTFYEADETKPFDGFTTEAYSMNLYTEEKTVFYTAKNIAPPAIQHRFVICWLGERYIQIMSAQSGTPPARPVSVPNPSSMPKFEFPDLSDDELEVIFEGDEKKDEEG